MKKNLLFLAMLGVGVTSLAQTTLTSSNLNPQAGESFTDNQCNYQSPGSAGANQTWDFSTLTSTGSQSTSYSATSVAGANLKADYGSSQAYILYNSSGQEMLQADNGSTVITYSDGEMLFQFPMAYGTTVTDDFRATFTSNGFPAVREGSNQQEADAYGTLILPGQTISDVIRIHYTQDYSDTIDIGTPYVVDYQTDIYIWYRAGYHSHLLSFTSYNFGGQTGSYGIYTNTTTVGTEAISGIDKVTILGNPVKDVINFQVEATTQKTINYSLYDALGQNVYLTNTSEISNGINSYSIDVNSLPSGMYALKISDNESAINKLIIIE